MRLIRYRIAFSKTVRALVRITLLFKRNGFVGFGDTPLILGFQNPHSQPLGMTTAVSVPLWQRQLWSVYTNKKSWRCGKPAGHADRIRYSSACSSLFQFQEIDDLIHLDIGYLSLFYIWPLSAFLPKSKVALQNLPKYGKVFTIHDKNRKTVLANERKSYEYRRQ